jgi:hypothetical protein
MSKHYIYEIFGRKIGATNDVERRMKQQGVNEGEYRIVEEHSNAKICSIREIELQREFNYPIDRIQYWKTLRAQKKGTTPEARKKAVANTDYKAKSANTDYKAISKKIDWKASRAKINYSNYTMNQCHTIEAISKRNKPVNQYDLEGNFIKKWDSQSQATKSLEIKSCADISSCCKGRQKTAYKYIWKYA